MKLETRNFTVTTDMQICSIDFDTSTSKQTVLKFWKFRRGGGVKFEGRFFGNSRGEGGYKANPFSEGGVWIFSGTTQWGARVLQ